MKVRVGEAVVENFFVFPVLMVFVIVSPKTYSIKINLHYSTHKS